MFDLGMQIVVLASNKRKNTGFRKGSVGFASTCLKSNTFGQYGFVATVNEIFFSRYGFELKDRVEKKIIVSIFPMIKPDQGDIETQVMSLIKRINSPKSYHIWDNIRNYFGLTKNVPVAFAVPLNYKRINLVNCSDNEFKAWINSIFRNSNFISWLNGLMATNHFVNSNMLNSNRESVRTIHQMVVDQDYKHTKLINICKNNTTKKSIIAVIKTLLAMAGRNEKTNLINYLNAVIYDTNITDKKKLFRSISDNTAICLYFPLVFEALKNKLTASNNTEALNIINTIETTKHSIMMLSSSL